MAIYFDRTTKTFYLEGKDITYAFFINKYGFAEHLYFGKRISRDTLLHLRATGGEVASATVPGNVYNAPFCSYQQFPAELSFFGTGYFNEPTVHLLNAEGDRLTELLYDGYEILDEKPQMKTMPSMRGGKTLKLKLRDYATDFCAELYYTVYDDVSVIARRVVYRNERSEAVKLERAYSFTLSLPDMKRDVISFYGAWASERQIQRTPMHHGVISVDSKVSRSTHLNPSMVIATSNANEEHGEAIGIALMYSSHFVLKAEGLPNGAAQITGGINDFDFEWTLEEGEELETPEVIIAYSDEGIGGMSRELHDAAREYIIDKKFVKKSRPIVINNWEGTYFDFNAEKLKAIADGVRGTGVDTFVLDDGWFGKRNNDRCALGDWWVNEEKLPGGLDAIISHVNSLGMKFGLWFEPEMISEDSDIYRAHPEYAIKAPLRKNCYSRQQFVMDITRADVRDYIVDSVNSILDSHNIEYVKWDYNRHATELYSALLPKDRQSEFAHRYALALYELCERIIKTHPQVFFEGCAGGGGRFDYGMLYYFPQIWTSDDSDAHERTHIQYGTSIIYPMSAMSCHVSAVPNHQTGRSTDMKTRADIAHLGATGYELDTSSFTDDDRNVTRGQVEEYRKHEELILSGDLYRLENPFESNFFAFMAVSKDKGNAILTAYRALGGVNREIYRIKPRGLDKSKKYFVPELNLILGGDTLMNAGLIPPFEDGDFKTVTYHFEEK